MSDAFTYPPVPYDLLMDRYEDIFDADYSRVWGQTIGLYHRKGVWCASVVLAAARDVVRESVTAAWLGASLGADQAVWYTAALDAEVPEYMADRFIVCLYADRWGTKAMRKRPVSINDDGQVLPSGEWEWGDTEGRFLEALTMAWELNPVDPDQLTRALRLKGHVVSTVDAR